MTTTISGENNGGTITWQGFDYGWRGEPHRLSRLGSHLDSFALQAEGRTVHARYISDFGVGNVNDTGDAITGVSSLIFQPLFFVHGFQTKTMSAELGKVSTASDEAVSVQLPGPGDLVAMPLLRGFDIAVTNFPSGFQTRGFGVQLIPGPLSGNALRFTPSFTIHPERSPDPLTRHPIGGGPSVYEYSMTAYFTVVAGPRRGIHFTSSLPASPTAVVAYQGPSQAQQQARAHIEGQGGRAFDHAVVGVQGFSWHLDDFEGTHFDGRYLRRIQCFMDEFSYDPASGAASFTAHLSFSNQGTAVFGYNAEHELWAGLIQFSSPIASTSKTLSNVVRTAQGVEVITEFTD